MCAKPHRIAEALKLCAAAVGRSCVACVCGLMRGFRHGSPPAGCDSYFDASPTRQANFETDED